ncbi:archease [Algoriphagus sp. CAU 1675]|uniref:archease n=1 Tax=Algoriphagus sp. CAU 1675 TaxID=3032597 RepID=UPI0023DBCCAE|nr:archease [Algoriphagus sp. CAU 1675]MDF2157173.1 archease [Algoriphagus sp. CAU 1675]
MKAFDYISHTADIRMRIRADSSPALFEAALEGMSQIIKADACKNPPFFTLTIPINLRSKNITTLLIEFLGEVLTHSHLHNAIFCKLQIKILNDHFISALIFGFPEEKIDEDIKAVTYHEADVKLNQDKQLETIIVFDI